MVVLLYCMRRVDCRACGVRVEAVLWGIGKHQLTKAHVRHGKLSWRETAVSCQSVEYVVQWGMMACVRRLLGGQGFVTRVKQSESTRWPQLMTFCRSTVKPSFMA